MADLTGTSLLGYQRQRGPASDLSRADLLLALIHHFLSGPGTLAEHVRVWFGFSRAESMMAERQAAFPWALFTGLLQGAAAARDEVKPYAGVLAGLAFVGDGRHEVQCE